MNKKGSHVGMILSFTLFITFILFLYTISKPALETNSDKKTICGKIESLLIQNTSSNLTTITVVIKQKPGDRESVELRGFLIISGLTFIPQFIIKNRDSRILDSYHKIPESVIVDRTSTDETVLKVYHSKEFSSLSESEGSASVKIRDNPEGYNIGSMTLDKYIFESQIEKLITFYDENYEQLKINLLVPSGIEFDFSFKKSDDTIMAPSIERLRSNNVYSEETPVQYVDENAIIQSGFINIQVW